MESGIKQVVHMGDRVFSFELCRKSENFATVPIDHWWMRTTELYRQRAEAGTTGKCRRHSRGVFALCQQAGSDGERSNCEVYTLAHLLPCVRNQGSRRIVKDAVPTCAAAGKAKREASDHELDQLLRCCESETLTELAFSRKTADVLGPPPLAPMVAAAYREFCQEFFDPVVDELLANSRKGITFALKAWQRFMTSIGRRGGRQQQKQVLDIISYEARAALHQCYSAVWHYLLLPQLRCDHALTNENITFLQFWHLDQIRPSNLGDVANFHLFHGHVFSLHPASGAFLRTATGRERMGQWLTQQSSAAYGQLLHGLYLSTFHYAEILDNTTLRRKKQPEYTPGTNLPNLEKQETRPHPRPKRRSEDD